MRKSYLSAAVAAAAFTGAASTFGAIAPYAADANTLGLYHFDEVAGAADPGNPFGNSGSNGVVLTNTGGPDGRSNTTTGGYGAASLTGFGSSFDVRNSGNGTYFSVANAQGGGARTSGAVTQSLFQGSSGAFTYEALFRISDTTGEQTFLSHDGDMAGSIIGNHNAIIYKEVFRFIKQNMIWLGCTHPVAFVVPNHYEMRAVRSWRTDDGTNWRSLGNACWFTNLDIAKRHEELPLFEKYDPRKFPTYDNYDAIEVTRYKEIPVDYDGVMGVPVTFLEQHNPEQFEIVGCNRGVDQDPKGVYGRGSHLNGKETFKRLFVRRRMESA